MAAISPLQVSTRPFTSRSKSDSSVGNAASSGGKTAASSSSSSISSSLLSSIARDTVRLSSRMNSSSAAAKSLSSSASSLLTTSDIQSRLEDLFQNDPEQAKRLMMVLQTLRRIDPEMANEFMDRLSSSLGIFQSQQPAQQAAASAAPAAAAQPQSTPTFVIEFDMQSSSTTTTTLAQLSDQGMQVQTTTVSSSSAIHVRIEFSSGAQQPTQQSDPLVIDLAGNGINLTSAPNGVHFDINGDGKSERTAFVQGDDAFLVYDRNGNGRIDGGRELFGDQNGARNGFEELRRYDDNADGIIDKKDSIFQSLRLLNDMNSDGMVAGTEISTLDESGIASISLQTAQRSQDDGKGNTLAEKAAYTRTNGSTGEIADAWVGYI